MNDKSRESIEKQVYAEALRKAARDYEELVDELSILRLLNDSFQAGMGFNDICDKLVRFVGDAMDVENASVMVMDREKQELRLLAAKAFYEDKGVIFVKQPWPGKVFKLGEGIAGQVAKNRKSVLINDTHQDTRFVETNGQKVSVRSILSLPLIHGDQLHGVLNLSNSEPGAFDARKEHTLTLVASTASVALSHAVVVEELKQLNEELTVRNKELAAVIALSESLHANLDLDTVLAESLKNVSDAFDIDTIGVFLENDETGNMDLRSYKSRSADPGVKRLLQSLSERFGQEIIRSRKPVLYFGPFEEAPHAETCLAEVRTCIGVALFSDEGCFGILMTLNSNGRGRDEAEITLLGSFFDQISMAIQNSVLISRLKENIRELRETKHKLVQSEKLALIGETLSGVAHEINNPLAAIMGYSELLLSEESSSEQSRAMLRRILLCVERSRKIVQGLLSFARRTELEKKKVDINEIIDKALEYRSYDLTVGNIEIVKDYEADAPLMLVDPYQMEQVFLNLINNAYDSMVGEESPRKLEIRTCLIEGPVMQIEFIDSGHGITEADKVRVFEPFFTTKEVGEGTGLGLSVSYGIVKEHGGNLYIDDSYHGGVKFVITLPVVPTKQAAEPPSKQEEVPEPPKSQGRILVVDDEEVITDFVQLALSSRGFVVDCASDAEKAYQMAGSNSYDLIITDIKMPGKMDGRDLFIKLRDEEPTAANRFVFISGDIMEEKTANFLKESGRAFLLKPFSIDDLRQVVEKTLLELPS